MGRRIINLDTASISQTWKDKENLFFIDVERQMGWLGLLERK